MLSQRLFEFSTSAPLLDSRAGTWNWSLSIVLWSGCASVRLGLSKLTWYHNKLGLFNDDSPVYCILPVISEGWNPSIFPLGRLWKLTEKINPSNNHYASGLVTLRKAVRKSFLLPSMNLTTTMSSNWSQECQA